MLPSPAEVRCARVHAMVILALQLVRQPAAALSVVLPCPVCGERLLRAEVGHDTRLADGRLAQSSRFATIHCCGCGLAEVRADVDH